MEPGSSVLIVVGSRPEAIKLAPIVRQLRAHANGFKAVICATGQQRDLLPQALAEFGLHADIDLEVMQPDQSLAGLTARLMTGLDGVLAARRPDWLLVQGDTTSAMVGALAGFYHHVPVGHVEAGLRTGDLRAPFPEEMNRRVITQCATLHFAPTIQAAQNLRAESVSDSRVFVTGNTIVDALLWIREECRRNPPAMPSALQSIEPGQRVVLVTSHRREHFGRDLEEICQGLLRLARALPDVAIVYPVHPNPHVRGPVEQMLGSERRIVLTDPLPYRVLVMLLDRASLVLTDSGGIQEEAPSFGKPVLVLRRKTERMEGIEAGTARLIGPEADGIVASSLALLTDDRAYDAMAKVVNPYGDGHAAERIVSLLENWNESVAFSDAAPAAR